MTIIAPRPDPGEIEQSLAGLTAKQRARVKALAHRDIWAALPAGQRVAFTQDGIQILLVNQPDVLRDRSGVIIGIRVVVRAREAGGGPFLPLTDGFHQVINPPVQVPNGTVHIEQREVPNPDFGNPAFPDATPTMVQDVEVPNFEERPLQAFKAWLVESVKLEARQNGWVG